MNDLTMLLISHKYSAHFTRPGLTSKHFVCVPYAHLKVFQFYLRGIMEHQISILNEIVHRNNTAIENNIFVNSDYTAC